MKMSLVVIALILTGILAGCSSDTSAKPSEIKSPPPPGGDLRPQSGPAAPTQ